MPLQKPSPHRFIAPAPPTQTPKQKPKSNLRHAIIAHTPELQFKKITPAKRFVAAPARAHADDEYDVTPRPKARKYERVESIEESQLASEEEDGGEDSEDEDELLFESVQRAKRRRTSPSSPPQQHLAPQMPLGIASHRFRLPAAQTPLPFCPNTTLHMPPASVTMNMTSVTSGSTPTTTRPHFLLPVPRSPSKPCTPLPEIFSPSRKAQKYLSNGLASSVQAWIIETAQQGPGAGIVWGREREDGVRVKIRVSELGGGDVEALECWLGGTTFVVGETETGMYDASRAESLEVGQGMRVLLAGHGGSRGSAGVKIRIGSIVGIRAPTWELDVGGEKWTVGVDWFVLH
ncbi:uncharacterized protein M421DRAFT_57065 [Didymella exigua CBS 183.55]|uniref:Uncharacterized protein n=1 Tax=Didymella exigua CBS 183.55 TaxID=1150837 RepID=A0A6A5S0U3_9PLEO|nr:uncharacterized protein M421DRAFT_57065 [Didymella exigua CBS 183.55]KAF1931127.1 hypothetical protein M421DRAFT_57065 [Didymella exigua CBS 183.55]